MNFDDQRISRVVFHPRSEPPGYVSRGIATTTTSGTARIGGCLHPNRSSRTLMLFFHGNGEIAADYDDLAEFYLGCGASFWVVDYRGYGRSTGEPSYSRMIEDAGAVLDDVPAGLNGPKSNRTAFWSWDAPWEALRQSTRLQSTPSVFTDSCWTAPSPTART